MTLSYPICNPMHITERGGTLNTLLDVLFRFPNTEEAGAEFVGSVLNLISVPAIAVDKRMRVGPANLQGRDLLPAEGKRSRSSRSTSSGKDSGSGSSGSADESHGAGRAPFPLLLRDKVRSVLKEQTAVVIKDFSAPGLRRKHYDLLLCPGEVQGMQHCFMLLLTPEPHEEPDLEWALKQLMGDIDGAAAFLDTDVRFRGFNQNYLAAFEAKPEDLDGKRITERNPSRQAEILEHQVRHLIAHRKIRDTSADSLTTASKGVVVASVKGWPVMSAERTPLGFFAIIRPSISSTPLPMADESAQDLFGKSAMLYGPPMFFTHLGGEIIAMNSSGRAMIQAAEGDPKNLKTAIPWDAPAMIENLYRDMLAGSDFSSFLSDITGPDGIRVIKVRAYGLKEIGDITSVVLLHLMDVTQEEATRNQLAENVRKYATEKTILAKVMEGLSSVRVGYVVLDRELTFLRVSDWVVEALGTDASSLVGRKVHEVDPSLRESGVLVYVKTTIDRRQSLTIESFPYTLPSGEQTMSTLGFHPIEIEGRNACLVTFEDQTEHRLRDAARARLQKRLDGLLEGSEEVLIFSDADGYVTDISSLVSRAMGKTREELVGMHIDDFTRLGVENAELFLEYIHRAMNSRKILRTGLISIKSKIRKAPIFVDATYIPVLDPDGSLEELIHIGRYRTEVVELSEKVNEQTQNLQRMISERTEELTQSNVLLENTVERLASMARSGLVLSSLADAESVIASFLKEVREVLDADFASVALISITDDTSKTTYYSSGAAPPSGVIPADVVERGLARLAVGNGAGEVIETDNPNVLIEEFTFSRFKGLMLAWRENEEFTALDGNLTKLLCTQLSFALPITRYVTDLRLERDRSQVLRRIAFRTAGATSVGSAVRIVAEELAKVLHADRFFWLVSGNQADLWLSEVYRGSGLPVRQTRHLTAEESECLEPLVEACNESHRIFCERFPGIGGDDFTGHRAFAGDTPCPFLRREEGTELAKCLRSLIKQAGMLGRESGALAIAPVTVSPTSWGMLCAYSDVGGAFSRDDMCFMCLAASTVRHMWQAADAAGSVRRLEAEGETVSELAHDLKYPLMRMNDSLGNLAPAKGGLQNEAALEDLRIEVQRLELLARELIDTSNRKKRIPEIVDITDILEYCVSLTAGDASDKSIEVRRRVETMPPPIFANSQDVKSILINILANAIDVAGKGGWVDITVEANGGRDECGAVVLAIEDSGPGVPKTELGRVFDPFYTTKEMGSGMGLFSSKKRARANGGDLVCEIGPSGKSRFVLWFPVASG